MLSAHVYADYRSEWWEPAKAAWNTNGTTNLYNFDWFDYTFPLDADHTPGTPPDVPIDGHTWMDLAGMGMSMKIDLPSSNGNYDYSDATIQAWKAKGFRNGRFHVTPYDPDFMDPDDNRILSQTALNDLRDTCQRFVDNGIPVVVSMNSDSEFTDDTDSSQAQREITFTNYLEWWRQIAEKLKDMSHLVTFENFIEYHGFPSDLEGKDFAVELNNGEVRYPDYENYRGRKVDNWVRFPGYNNLMHEWSKVVRETNPTRMLIYKPNGIGRGSMPNITPYRYDTEGDPQGINNTNAPYWAQSVGGSANTKWQFVAATREADGSQAQLDLLAEARQNSWGPAADYFRGTGNPTWISLWGLQLTQDSIDNNLGGITPPDSIFLDYIDWYQNGVQHVLSPSGEERKLPCGFQQSWWLWDFSTDTWFESDQGANIGNPVPVRESLSSWTWQPGEAPPSTNTTAYVLARYDFAGGSMASSDTNANSTASNMVPGSKAALATATNNAALVASSLIESPDEDPIMEFTVTADSGNVLDLTSLSYDWMGQVNQADTHTNRVFSSLDSFAVPIINAVLALSGTDTASMDVDLSGTQYQGVTSITFRVYHDISSRAGQDSGGILSSKTSGSFLGLTVSAGDYQDVVLRGTAHDPDFVDTDLDGIPDDLDDDDDNDGLLDVDEPTYSTNPLLADTDGGSMNDGAEVAAGLNPLNPSDDTLEASIARYEFNGGSLVSIDAETNSAASDLIPHALADLSYATNNAALGTSNQLRTDDGPMMEFTVSAEAGSELNLLSLNYAAFAGAGDAETHVSRVRSSVDGFASDIANTAINLATNTLATNVVVDLSGAAFQSINSITFRVYHQITVNTGQDWGGILGSKSSGDFLGLSGVVAGAFPDVILNAKVAYDANIADTDGDGMIDAAENQYGFDILDPADADEDPDTDGMSNLNEIFAGTNPTDSNSVFAISSFDPGVMPIRLDWMSISGRTYFVEYSADLVTWNLLPGAESVLASSAETGAVDTNEAVTVRFYRAGVTSE